MINVLAFVYGVLICVHIHHTAVRSANATTESWCELSLKEGIVMTLLCMFWPVYWAGRLLDVGTQKLLPPPGESP